MKQFKEYKSTKNADGTINLLDFEMFKLGQHKGFNYDADWAAKALANFETEKSTNDYLPPAFIGHTDGKEEKPVEGFLDNMKIDGDIIKVDLTGIPADLAKKFPNRSVEVNNEKALFTGLALLGSTRPYHKFPNKNNIAFGEGEDLERIDFEEGDFSLIEESLSDKMKGFVTSFFKGDEGQSIIKNEISNFKENDDMKFTEEQMKEAMELTNAQFKEKHGVTPEEALTQFKAAQKEKADKLVADYKAKIAAFAEGLKKDKRVKPAIVDGLISVFAASMNPQKAEVIQFQEDGKDVEQSSVDFFQGMITSIFEEAAKGTLFVPEGEMEGLEFSENVSSSDSKIIDAKATAKAKKYMAEGQFKDEVAAYNFAVDEILDELEIAKSK